MREPGEQDFFVLAEWHAPLWHVQLFFLLDVDDRPRPDWASTPDGTRAYKWHSYHAAKKFLREHSLELKGYFVCNLSKINREWKAGLKH